MRPSGSAICGSVPCSLGLSWRVADALVPYVGFKHNNLQMGFSYDADISSLGSSVAFTNSMEISITVVGNRPDNTKQHYGCPPRF